MKRIGLVLLVGLGALVAAASLAAVQPSAQAAPLAKNRATVDMELIVELGKAADGTPATVETIVKAVENLHSRSGLDGFAVDSFFDITYVSNIGSSGLDGFAVDSFFDITYRVDTPSGVKVDIELVALSLRSSLADPVTPAGALDAVIKAVGEAGGGVCYGHVTVLK